MLANVGIPRAESPLLSSDTLNIQGIKVDRPGIAEVGQSKATDESSTTPLGVDQKPSSALEASFTSARRPSGSRILIAARQVLLPIGP